MAKQPPKKSRRKLTSKPHREHIASRDQRTPGFRDRFSRMVVPPELHDPEKRQQWNLEEGEHKRGPYIVTLNAQHHGGLPGAANALEQMCSILFSEPEGPPRPVRIAKAYYRCEFSVSEWGQLLTRDQQLARERAYADSQSRTIVWDEPFTAADTPDPFRYQAIAKLWPDFPLFGQIDRSIATIKADAAWRAFDASGEQITWAVIDSGVDASHPHFGAEGNLLADVADLHRCFVAGDDGKRLPDPDSDPSLPEGLRDVRVAEHKSHALTDEFGHGTHVAGIIAGRAPQGSRVWAFTPDDVADPAGGVAERTYRRRRIQDSGRLHGVAPKCRVISLKVLNARGEGRTSDVIQALEYIREHLNTDPRLPRVHGVNLSVGYEFDAELYACGQSPLCEQVNLLVHSGVVVVAAAGNTGYGTVASAARLTRAGLSNTINDPGNASEAITVGATHRDAPYMYGVSYFSSKGPTGDGRLKPDLVAPGERITSCCAGARLTDVFKTIGGAPSDRDCFYIEDSGTSMAAPHVSGAIAAFLSIRGEFIGRPLDVKRIFLDTATPLGRERYFEGRGLIDLMRAIQSV